MRIKPLPSAVILRPLSNWALFLDVDGTLLHLQETPDGVTRSERVCQVLEDIMARLNGALALVSGRNIATVDKLFTPHRFPIAGLHGLERRDAIGQVHGVAASQTLETLRPSLHQLVDAHQGAMMEDKSGALAIHYRQAPDKANAIRKQVEALIRPLAHELHVIHGKMVSEIKPWHADKGSAISDFMKEPPFEGRVPVFIGDDVTDEDGFAYVNDNDGFSVRVGDGAATAAQYGLASVDAVIDWLEHISSSLQQEKTGNNQ